MQIWKKIAGIILAGCVAAAILTVPNAEAYAKAQVRQKSVTITTGNYYYSSIYIDYSKGDAQIKNLKSSSSNLIARQTRQYCEEQGSYNYAQIGLHARKSGSYKVTFDVCDAKGKKNSHHTIKVKAVGIEYEAGNYPIKKVTFAGKRITYGQLMGKKSGKFKVSLNKGYKLQSIEMRYYVASGKELTKKIKNNANVTLGSYAYKHESGSSDEDYWYYNLSTDLFANTEFLITVQDSKTKAAQTYYYTLYRMSKN